MTAIEKLIDAAEAALKSWDNWNIDVTAIIGRKTTIGHCWPELAALRDAVTECKTATVRPVRSGRVMDALEVEIVHLLVQHARTIAHDGVAPSIQATAGAIIDLVLAHVPDRRQADRRNPMHRVGFWRSFWGFDRRQNRQRRQLRLNVRTREQLNIPTAERRNTTATRRKAAGRRDGAKNPGYYARRKSDLSRYSPETDRRTGAERRGGGDAEDERMANEVGRFRGTILDRMADTKERS